MTFSDDLRKFALTAEERTNGVFAGVVSEVQRSVVEGSAITGSPGQPVDTGALRASWQTSFPSDHTALVSTNLEYAQAIEDGVGPHGPLKLRSPVGGFHSVAATINAHGKTVESERRKVVR